MAGLKVLLVDDEAGILDLIREYMASGDYEARMKRQMGSWHWKC